MWGQNTTEDNLLNPLGSLLGRRFPKDCQYLLPACKQAITAGQVGLKGVSTCHQRVCTWTCMIVLHLQVCITWRAGESQGPSLPGGQRREKKQETRAGPGPPQQHQNVGCSSIWWTASPAQVSPSSFGHHTEKTHPKSWSLWLCLPSHHWETEPGDAASSQGLECPSTSEC